MRKIHFKKAQSTLEIAAFLILIVGAMLVFQKYIAQGIYGRWKGVGDSWSHGRQYDKNQTTECIYNIWGEDTANNRPALWYNAICFEDNCRLDCIGVTSSPSKCDTCLNAQCQLDRCNQ